jgi:hypothetical protein
MQLFRHADTDELVVLHEDVLTSVVTVLQARLSSLTSAKKQD